MTNVQLRTVPLFYALLQREICNWSGNVAMKFLQETGQVAAKWAADMASCCHVQHGMWTGKTALASGANGSVFLVTNPFFPHAVLKKGWEHLLEEEAEKLWVLRHPNIVTLYTRLQTGEIGPDGIRTGWLALQRCGPTLASLKARRPRLSGRDRYDMPHACCSLSRHIPWHLGVLQCCGIAWTHEGLTPKTGHVL